MPHVIERCRLISLCFLKNVLMNLVFQVTAHFWQTWKEFEIRHGNEDTIREMLRIKRSVQATYNTQVNFMSSQMLKATTSSTGTGETTCTNFQRKLLSNQKFMFFLWPEVPDRDICLRDVSLHLNIVNLEGTQTAMLLYCCWKKSTAMSLSRNREPVNQQHP